MEPRVGGSSLCGFLRGRHFLSLQGVSPDEVEALLRSAAAWKQGRTAERPLAGRAVALLFRKPSTRTRVALEVAVADLGGYPLYLNAQDLQLSRGETAADTARVLSRMVAAIAVRTFAHAEAEELARNASVPVVNALTDLWHPTQALADLLTVRERLGRLRGVRLAYVGDGNNVAHSLLAAGALTGMEVVVAAPPGYEPNPSVVAAARAEAVRTGGRVTVCVDPEEAVRGADVVYTDVWTSMGDEGQEAQRREVFAPYRVDARLMALAAPHAIFLHCLPAHRGEEVTDDVIDGPASAVFDQAENRLHTLKALLAALV